MFWGVLGFLKKAYSLGFFCLKTATRESSSLAAVGVYPDKTYQN